MDAFIDFLIDEVLFPDLKEGKDDVGSRERETLIERLVKIYPYPREWFEKLNSKQLIAMYHRTSEHHNAAILTYKKPVDTSHRIDNPEDKGQTLIKTDGHGWEPEQN